MFHSIYRTSIPVLVLLIFGFQTIFFSPESYAQGLMKISDVPGGSGGTTSQSQASEEDGTALLIIGGVIIAGFLFYKLVLDKDDPKEEEEQDSTSNQSLLLGSNTDFVSNIPSENLKKIQEIPVNLYFGYQRVNCVLPERKFVMGISYNF